MSEGIFGPYWRIDGPPPEAPVYNVIGASRVIDDVDQDQIDRWINGVQVYGYPTELAQVWDACAPGSEAVEKSEGGAVPIPIFGAMTLYLAETCNTAGIFGRGLSDTEAQNRFTARALAALGAVEAAAVEKEILTGEVLGANPHLADGNGTFPWGDNPTSIVNAIAMLENEIAKSGKRGVIHLSPAAATVAANERVLERETIAGSPVLVTINGTIAVPGYGYVLGATPAGHPDPADATNEWIYASGPIEVRRSPAFVVPGELREALDRETNTVTYRAERYYVADWDTAVQAAVLVDRCTSDCGTPPA